MTTKVALYCRVSTEEQLEGYSIDAQKRAFSALCQGRGWTPFREYIEEGRSARTENIDKRPVFKEMVADALAGKFNIMVVHKLDRFSRNLRLTLEYFEKLSKAGVAFVSISEQVDYSTPSGKVYLAMLGAFAQFYSDNLSEETKKGKRERKAQGLYNGLLPFGTMKGPDKIPVPNPDTCPGLVMAYELAAQGESDKVIARALNEAGYRTWGTHGSNPFSKDTVRDILQNRFYVGELPDGRGGWVKGRHGRIIPPELFEAAQEARASRRHLPQTIPSKARYYSLSGVARCATCGSRLRVSNSLHPHLACARRLDSGGCREKSAGLGRLESQMAAYLRAFKLPQGYQEKMLALCHDKQPEKTTESDTASISTRLSRLKELYLLGDVEKAEYLAERQMLQARLAKVTIVQAKPDYLSRMGQFLQDLSLAWEAAEQQQRKRLVAEVFEAVWVKDALILGVTPKADMMPFFDMVHGEASTVLQTYGPDGIRTRVPAQHQLKFQSLRMTRS